MSKTFDGILDERSVNLLSLAIEDMLAYIIQNNDDLKSIDFIVNITDENVVLSIKDEGKEFNPTVTDDGEEFSNIAILNKISDKIEYARVIGLNSTVITLNRQWEFKKKFDSVNSESIQWIVVYAITFIYYFFNQTYFTAITIKNNDTYRLILIFI